MRSELHKTNYVIQSVANALDLLELFQESTAELGITDLSNKLHLNKNIVFRLIMTLDSKNYIEKNTSSGKYRLGVKTRALGHMAIRQTDFHQYARPFLISLNLHCRETCYFSVISGTHSYYLDGIESDLPVRVIQWIGTRRPLHCSASGKVQLAFLPQEEREKILSGMELKSFTETTIINSIQLREELGLISQQGFAVENQEHDRGVIEVAAPVFDCFGSVLGALSISGPTMRISEKRIRAELAPLLCREAERLSKQFA